MTTITSTGSSQCCRCECGNCRYRCLMWQAHLAPPNCPRCGSFAFTKTPTMSYTKLPFPRGIPPDLSHSSRHTLIDKEMTKI